MKTIDADKDDTFLVLQFKEDKRLKCSLFFHLLTQMFCQTFIPYFYLDCFSFWIWI